MPALSVVLLTLIAVVVVSAGSAAAATPVDGTFAVSPEAALARWTPARRAAAEPLGVLARSRPAGTIVGAVEGVDTGDPTAFPNRAVGTVYGEYVTSEGVESYQCSGSVIDSPAGNVVLTAGHCVIDPDTGAVARSVVFVPGYREGAEPFGAFAASRWVTTPEWESTAGTLDPDEAGDLAMLVLAPSTASGASAQATVGALSIAFEEAREQTYTQWGYPGESPYNGEVLYAHTTPYAGVDPSYPPATAPIKIASDFTAGASGGPWTIGPTTAPTVVSLTDYYYEFDPRHVYGAWFGAAARQAYELAGGVVVPQATTSTGGAEVTPAESPVTPRPEPVASTSARPAASAVPSVAGRLVILAADGHSTHGRSSLVAQVDGPGRLRLRGAAVRTVSTEATAAGSYRLAVIVKAVGAAARALRSKGSATVGVWVRFTSSVGVRQVFRLVRLGSCGSVPQC